MTELLKKAFDEAAQLPEDQQDAIASLLLLGPVHWLAIAGAVEASGPP